MMKKILRVLALILLIIPTMALGADVTLQWDANTEADLAGYKIYYDMDSGVPYDGTVSTNGISPVTLMLSDLADPSNPEITLSGFDPYLDYYFVATAFDMEVIPLESDYSNEVMLEQKYISGKPEAPTLRQVFWKFITSMINFFRGGLTATWS